MIRGTIDLHIHSVCSDGLDTPEEIVDVYIQEGFKYISITDHDTVSGIQRALDAACHTTLEVIPGIELSSIIDFYDVHILGYYMDFNNEEFLERIAFFKDKRRDRAEKIVKNLNLLGLDIQFDTVLRIAHGAPLGRPHIAEALLSEELVNTYNEAFVRYIGDQGPAYEPKYYVTPREAIEIIRKCGGIPVIAHPAVLNQDEIIVELVEYGLAGIEAIHPLHTPEKQLYYEEMAKKYGLLITGGSDWHGRGRSSMARLASNMGAVPQKTIHDMEVLLEGGKISDERFTG